MNSAVTGESNAATYTIAVELLMRESQPPTRSSCIRVQRYEISTNTRPASVTVGFSILSGPDEEEKKRKRREKENPRDSRTPRRRRRRDCAMAFARLFSTAAKCSNMRARRCLCTVCNFISLSLSLFPPSMTRAIARPRGRELNRRLARSFPFFPPTPTRNRVCQRDADLRQEGIRARFLRSLV